MSDRHGTGVLMFGNHKVTSLDDISKYSDLVANNFASLTDGRAEANEIQQGLKSEAEIAAYTLDERLDTLDRLRYFLFHKNSTHLQRQVGLSTLVSSVCVCRTPVGGASHLDSSIAPHRSVSGAAALASGRAAPRLAYEFVDSGERILDAILPELHKTLLNGIWEMDIQTKVASVYTDLLERHILQRKVLETIVAPFLMRMLDGSTHGAGGTGAEELSDEYIHVWLQPLLACIDALGTPPPPPPHPTPAPPPSSLSPHSNHMPAPPASPSVARNFMSPRKSITSPTHAATSPSSSSSASAAAAANVAAPTPAPFQPSPILSGSILDFSLKKGTQYLLSQPVQTRVVCVQIWGQLYPYLDWRLIEERLLEPALAMCQDTSGSVRYHMSRHLVPLLRALAPTFAHAKHAHALPPSPSSSPSSPASPVPCLLCPPSPSTPLDSRHPFHLLLVELDELLKDEEREVRSRAFQTLIESLDLFPEHARRTRIIPVLRNMMAIPPKGMMILIATQFGRIIFKLKKDLIRTNTTTTGDGGNSPSASSSYSSIQPLDASLSQLVKTLIAFYKNLPFLNATHAPELMSPNASSSSSSSLSSSLGVGVGLSTSNLSHDPKRFCAQSFVAVLSILGRVTTIASASPSSASSHATGAGGGMNTIPEVRFFTEHLSNLLNKLMKDDDLDVKGTIATSMFEIVNCLAGLGSTLTQEYIQNTSPSSSSSHTHTHTHHHHHTKSNTLPQVHGGIGHSSSFKLMKDHLLGMIHEGINSYGTNGNQTSTSTSMTNNTTSTSKSTSSSNLSLVVSVPSPGPSASSLSSSSTTDLCQLLIEGGKLESMIDVFHACHFAASNQRHASVVVGGGSGGPWVHSAFYPSSSSTVTLTPHSDTILDSWSTFLHDLLRALWSYDSQLSHTYRWRLKLSFLKAIHFLIRPKEEMNLLTTTTTTTTTNATTTTKRNGTVVSSPSHGHNNHANSNPTNPTNPSPAHVRHYFGHCIGVHTFGDVTNSIFHFEKLTTTLFHHLHSSPQRLKHYASDMLLTLFITSPFALRRSELVQRILREFQSSRSYQDRICFVELCARMLGVRTEKEEEEDQMEEEETTYTSSSSSSSSSHRMGGGSVNGVIDCKKRISTRLFKKYFYLPLLSLASDMVVNVRRQFLKRSPNLWLHLKGMLNVTKASSSSSVTSSTTTVNGGVGGVPSKLLSSSGSGSDSILYEVWKKSFISWKTMLSTNEFEQVREMLEKIETTTSPSTSASSLSNEAQLEEMEEQLLRTEELWLQEERHRSALSMAGGNVSLAMTAIAQANNYTPQAPEKGTGNGSNNANSNNSSSSSSSVGGGVSSSTNDKSSTSKSILRRSSLGPHGLKHVSTHHLTSSSSSPSDALSTPSSGGGGSASSTPSGASMTTLELPPPPPLSNKRRSANTDTMASMNRAMSNASGGVGVGHSPSSSVGSSSSSSSSTSNSGSSLAASRVAAAAAKNSAKFKSIIGANGNNTTMTTSTTTTSVTQATSSATAAANSNNHANQNGTTQSLNPNKSIRRYGSTPATGAGPGVGVSVGGGSPLLSSSTGPPPIVRVGSSSSTIVSGKPPLSVATSNLANGNNSTSMTPSTSTMTSGATTSTTTIRNVASAGRRSPNTPMSAGSPPAAPLGTRPNRGALDFPSSRSTHHSSSNSNTNGSFDAKSGNGDDAKYLEIDPASSSRVSASSAANASNGSSSTDTAAAVAAVATRVRPSAVAVRSSKLLSANLSLSAARIVASSSGGAATPNAGAVSHPPSPSAAATPVATPTNHAAASAGARASALSSGSTLSIGRSGSPALGAARPRIGTRTGVSGGSFSLGSSSDRSGERDASGGSSANGTSLIGNHGHSLSFGSGSSALLNNGSHNQTAAALLNLGMEHHHAALSSPSSSSSSSLAVGRRAPAARSTTMTQVVLPKLEPGITTSQHHPSSMSSPSSVAIGTTGSSSKLYSKEPPAHAHMRKFKLSQRSQLPTAELLASSSLGDTHGGGNGMGGGIGGVGIGRRRSLSSGAITGSHART